MSRKYLSLISVCIALISSPSYAEGIVIGDPVYPTMIEMEKECKQSQLVQKMRKTRLALHSHFKILQQIAIDKEELHDLLAFAGTGELFEEVELTGEIFLWTSRAVFVSTAAFAGGLAVASRTFIGAVPGLITVFVGSAKGGWEADIAERKLKGSAYVNFIIEKLKKTYGKNLDINSYITYLERDLLSEQKAIRQVVNQSKEIDDFYKSAIYRAVNLYYINLQTEAQFALEYQNYDRLFHTCLELQR